jgi:hypothetical protein
MEMCVESQSETSGQILEVLSSLISKVDEMQRRQDSVTHTEMEAFKDTFLQAIRPIGADIGQRCLDAIASLDPKFRELLNVMSESNTVLSRSPACIDVSTPATAAVAVTWSSNPAKFSGLLLRPPERFRPPLKDTHPAWSPFFLWA